MAKIIVAEDEDHIAIGIELNLKLKGHEVIRARDGEEAISAFKAHKCQMMVLDIMMPKMDGLSVLKKIRETDRKFPILILTAKDQVSDKVYAFKHGVDDYLSKPFALEEFLLRVERLIERASWVDTEEVRGEEKFIFGDNMVSLFEMKAWTRDGEIVLTLQECQLLKVFFDKQNTPVSRKELLEMAWGYQGDMSTRTIDNFIVRLRRYFEPDPKNPRHFKSLRSVGYVFNVD
jgi:two-component system alkaline phosphatase synthesis response regulator PhoP